MRPARIVQAMRDFVQMRDEHDLDPPSSNAQVICEAISEPSLSVVAAKDPLNSTIAFGLISSPINTPRLRSRKMTTSDLDRSADDALRQYGIPSILWLIYGSIATFALVVIGCFKRYKYVNPDTPAVQLTRAVDALGSGQDLDAHRLFEKLAANGNPAAEYWLADIYQYGLGTAKSLPAAVALFQTSAVKGFVPAQLRLGELYLAGTEIDPDYAKARDLLGKAAATGDATAQRFLGQMYEAGLGEPRDPFLAAVDYSAAAAHGNRLAAPERDSIMPQLSPDQIAQIQPERAKLGLTK